MRKIYGVKAYGGEYSEAWEYILFMSFDEQLCIDTANALNKRFKEAYEWYRNEEGLSYEDVDKYLEDNFNLGYADMFCNSTSYEVVEIPLVSDAHELAELDL